ncbi:MAG: H(+)/Cl(-) exchange transporter ClcA, partial [Candidatus Hydrogenedentales bacterium]
MKKFHTWHVLSSGRRHQYWRAALVGLLAGGVALLFQRSLESAEAIRNHFLATLHLSSPSWGWLALPVLGALIGVFVGWMTSRFAPEASGSGIPNVKGVLMHVSTLSWKRILPVKFLGGLLCIGAGFSLGREGPTVQMGAAVAKFVSDVLRVPAKASPRLMACGAGAGLAAAFHAPLAGFIFTVEELQREFSSLTYAMALIAAVVADIVTTSYRGSANAFHASGFPAASLSSLPVCVTIGIMAGFSGAAFNKSLLSLQNFSHQHLKAPAWVRAGIAGAVVGLIAWWLPEAVGGGHQIVEHMLHGGFVGSESVRFLLLLFAGKFLLTLLCYVSGVPGGIFAPMLVIGACVGLLTGIGASVTLPALAPTPESFAVVGMAAFFSAVVRAPLTGIVLVLEMTGDYQQLLPVLTGSMVAYVLSERLGIDPIYDALLSYDIQRKNPDVPAHREPVLLEFVIQEESAMDGRRIKDVPLPERCLFVTVTRNGNDILPDGNTELHRGDHITAVISGANAA